MKLISEEALYESHLLLMWSSILSQVTYIDFAVSSMDKRDIRLNNLKSSIELLPAKMFRFTFSGI